MNTILIAFLLAATAFATPLSLHAVSDNNAATLHTRQDSGITISFYTKAKCNGDGVDEGTMKYNTNYAQQIRSYKLGSDLGPDDVLNISNDVNWKSTASNPVDPSNLAACAQLTYKLEGKNTKKGCHTLPKVVDCMMMTY